MKILVIRRDNIGDLVCTTPVFSALRNVYPGARISALVNSYNAPVLAGNPSVDDVFVYTKLKHRAPEQSRLRLLWQRYLLHRTLKKAHFDYVLLPNAQPRLLRFALGLHPKRVVALGETATPSMAVTMLPPIGQGVEHEAQAVYRLLEPLGIHDTPPAATVVPNAAEAAKARAALDTLSAAGPVVAIHISARKPSQRWPAERFVDLMRALHARYGLRFLLLWAPGSQTNPLHPGDDEKAQAIIEATRDLPVVPYATRALAELIGALSICDAVVCSDGGAMHLAAGLRKPIVCMFGRSDAWRWHPWGVPSELLQAPSFDVNDISVGQTLDAYERLRNHTPPS